ncbi:hypothetical protein EIQ31_20490 [Agrobacterium deltaense]|nr:hypothetical protein EIQ31_20490 [Agrobacterium deltaense]
MRMVSVLVHWAPSKGRKNPVQPCDAFAQPVVADLKGMFILGCHPCISWLIRLQACHGILNIVSTASCRQSPRHVLAVPKRRAKACGEPPPHGRDAVWTCALKMEKNRPRYFPVRCRRNIIVTFLSRHRFVKP